MSIYTRNLPDMWDDFHRSRIDRKVDEGTYKKIVVGFNAFLAEKILDGYDVYLPGNLGHMGIRGMHVNPQVNKEGEISGLPVDWKETRNLWRTDPIARAKKKLIYHFNEHTNGVTYTVHWHKEHIEIPNRTIYSFRISREIRDKMRIAIKAGVEYAEKLIPAKMKKYAKQVTTENEVKAEEQPLW
jgi:hypothetical protein